MIDFLEKPTVLVLLLLLVVVFGAKRLPDSARALGRSLRIFKAETRGLREDEKAAAVSPNALAPAATSPVPVPPAPVPPGTFPPVPAADPAADQLGRPPGGATYAPADQVSQPPGPA